MRLLGGSWAVINGVTVPRIGITLTLLITPLRTTKYAVLGPLGSVKATEPSLDCLGFRVQGFRGFRGGWSVGGERLVGFLLV